MPLEIGKSYTLGYGIGRVKIIKSDVKNKAKAAVRLSDDKRINFGDPSMRNAPGTERAERFCARAGNLNERGFNAATLSLIEWGCIGRKSGADCIFDKFKAGTLRSSSGELVTSFSDAMGDL